jgi:hypothetical protein
MVGEKRREDERKVRIKKEKIEDKAKKVNVKVQNEERETQETQRRQTTGLRMELGLLEADRHCLVANTSQKCTESLNKANG